MKNLVDIDVLSAHLRKYGLFAKKSFGQNFLVDERALNAIIAAADLTSSDRVVEVGPGPGVLSQRMAPLVSALTAVEIDQKMIGPWKDLMREHVNAQILRQDVLDYVPSQEPYKLVANIPYYITSPILKHFLRHQGVRRPDLIVLLMQKEVAERICDLDRPTLLTWEIQIFGSPEFVCRVPASSFYPSPKVDSAVLKIAVREQPLLPEEMLEDFFQFLMVCYKQPRKTLLNNLTSAGRWKRDVVLDALKKAKVDGGLRPHQLKLEEWKGLFTASKDS